MSCKKMSYSPTSSPAVLDNFNSTTSFFNEISFVISFSLPLKFLVVEKSYADKSTVLGLIVKINCF